MCWRQEQVRAGLAPGSIERTADSLAFVTERLRRLCALQSYRLIWDSPFRKTNLTWSFVGCEDAGF